MQQTLHPGRGLGGLEYAGAGTGSFHAYASQPLLTEKAGLKLPQVDTHEAGAGDINRQRRKSRLGFIGSLFPQLTSSSTDPPYLPPRRKPVLAQFQTGPSTNDPQHPSHLGSEAQTISPPPPPPKEFEPHPHKPLLPKMLKKVQKVPEVLHSALPVPGTQADAKKSRERAKSASPARPATGGKLQSNRSQPQDAPVPVPKIRSSSAQPPKGRFVPVEAPRVMANPADLTPPSQSGEKSKRRSWLPGARSRSSSHDYGKNKGGGAFIITPDGRSDYNLMGLENGDKVPELWNENGNVYVYLFSKESGLGPSFKVEDRVFSTSQVFNELLLSEKIFGTESREPRSTNLLSVNDATRRPFAPPTGNEGHLYLPFGNPTLDLLVTARNLFAFLTNQPLVGTKQHPTIFTTLLQVAGMLRDFSFTSIDGSSYGEPVDAAFEQLLEQFGLGDVRHSREKTIEALILGEQMRSWKLYNEAFAHAVGKYDDILDLKSPLFAQISPSTRNRLERAHLDLENRYGNINLRIETFDFPSLFAGVASSTSMEEYKTVKFKEWRVYYNKMRSFVMGYYKDQFGNWPPKARSKKNNFSHSGLNRQCLKILYSDLCALYDLLVDRESITPRVIDQAFEDENEKAVDPMISALRQMLSEFDRSSPPVLPPVPYDIPKIPSLKSIYENYHDLSAKKQAKFDKALQPNELLLVLIKSHNIDTDSLQIPFLQAFKDFELKEAKSVAPQEIADQRIGHWLFLYAVIQSLPMLVVDAPDLKHTEGVEYFLCEPPQGNVPWMVEDAGDVRKVWYQTAGGQGIVQLSADVVMFSVEGVYMRSHCWLAAKEWEMNQQAQLLGGDGSFAADAGDVAGLGGVASPLQPPRAVFEDMDPANMGAGSGTGGERRVSYGNGSGSPGSAPGSRNTSPARGRARNAAYRSSIAIGLEPLPLTEGLPSGGPGGLVDGGSQRGSRVFSAGSSFSGVSGLNGPSGAIPPRPLSSHGAGGITPPPPQLALRNSRSNGNLYAAGGWANGSGGEGSTSQPPRKVSYQGSFPLAQQQQPQRPASNQGGPAPSIASGSTGASSATVGGSTFDDILKGMDSGKKKKKGFFG